MGGENGSFGILRSTRLVFYVGPAVLLFLFSVFLAFGLAGRGHHLSSQHFASVIFAWSGCIFCCKLCTLLYIYVVWFGG